MGDAWQQKLKTLLFRYEDSEQEQQLEDEHQDKFIMKIK
jgi:hypothetical protein